LDLNRYWFLDNSLYLYNSLSNDWAFNNLFDFYDFCNWLLDDLLNVFGDHLRLCRHLLGEMVLADVHLGLGTSVVKGHLGATIL
jgi:hypothetical protein